MDKNRFKSSLQISTSPNYRAKEYSHSAYNRCVTFSGKRYSRLQTFSRKSNRQINELIKTMSSICSTMLRSHGDTLAERQIGSSALMASSRLHNSIKLNQNIIKQYDIQNHNDKFLSYENINEFKSSGKSLTHSKNKQSQQLPKEESDNDDNFEMFEGTEDEQEKALNMMYEKKFKEITKLQKLKGEILMMEQKKKYALNKKYEAPKQYKDSYFLRDAPSKLSLQLKNIKPKYMKYNTLNTTESKASSSSQTRNNKNNLDNNNSMMYNYYMLSPSLSTLPSSSRPTSKTTKSKLSKRLNFNCINTNININTNTNTTTISNINSTHEHSNINTNTNASTSPLKNDLLLTRTTLTKSNSLKHRNKPPLSATILNTSNNNNNNYNKLFNTISNRKSKLTLKKQKRIPQTFLNKVKTIHVKAYEQNTKIKNEIDKSRHQFQEFKKYRGVIPTTSSNKSEIDINKINDEFNFKNKRKESFDYKNIDDVTIIKQNADKVRKHLDKKCGIILTGIVNQILYYQKILNKKMYLDSKYERRLLTLRLKKDFKKVCDETIAIEKQLIGEGVEPPNERDAIISMITELIKTKENSYEELLDLKRKKNVMRDIKPLLFERKKKIKDGYHHM